MTGLLAAIPAVGDVLADRAFQAAAGVLSPPMQTRLVRKCLADLRADLLAGRCPAGAPAEVALLAVNNSIREAVSIRHPFPGRVVNGTGVIIHTNLGRAPLGEALRAVDLAACSGYTDLEWDKSTQQRSERTRIVARQLELLTGCEAALLVNNCASAVMLALNTLAFGKHAVISRSELVEIGGSFRLPEIIAAAGCRLKEVGTTNRTRLADYRASARPGESVLLRVHQSNFVQSGFVERPATSDLVELARSLGTPLIEDNGSGLLMPNASTPGEPSITESISLGVDVIVCSADKLFGGVQAGLIFGRGAMVEAMRANPMYRALRLDKIRLALLRQTFLYYLAGRADELPVWRMHDATLDQLRERLAALRFPAPGSRWEICEVSALSATFGGGSDPGRSIDSLGLQLLHHDISAEALQRRFASRNVPILGYVRRGRFHLDVRTVLPDEFVHLQDALDELS